MISIDPRERRELLRRLDKIDAAISRILREIYRAQLIMEDRR